MKNKFIKTATKESSLSDSFGKLSDGILTLVRQHLELFREEAKQDVKLATKRYIKIAIGTGVLVLAWLFLNLTLVLGAGAWFGLKIAALLALIESFVHFMIGIYFIRTTSNQLKTSEGPLLLAKQELERSSKWVKQIKKEKKPSSSIE